MHPKQKEVSQYLLTVENATLHDIYKNVSFSYYCNEMKHLGNLLSRMVKNGTIERVKKGVFKIAKGKINTTKQIVNPNQTTLF